MKADSHLACSIIAIAFTAAASARAGEIPIDISGLVNEPWTFSGPDGAGIINGSTYPTGNQNFGGIPFAIPIGPNNYWEGAAAANFGSGTVSLTIPIGVPGVTSVFTLLNSMWGHAGPQAYLFVTFNGSNGATATQPLVGNVNVRDYNNDGNTNTINNTATVQVWDNGLGQRLDRQEYILPAAFASQVLTQRNDYRYRKPGSGQQPRGLFRDHRQYVPCLCYGNNRDFQQQDRLRPGLETVLAGSLSGQHRPDGRGRSPLLYFGRSPGRGQTREQIGSDGMLRANWQPVC